MAGGLVLAWTFDAQRLEGIGEHYLLIGDFNAILAQHEKEGGRHKPASSVTGRKFTWSNRQFGENLIRERLGRCFVSNRWLAEYPNARALHLEDMGSDHRPIIIQTDQQVQKQKRRFRFQERWCELEEVQNIIKEAWQQNFSGSPMYILFSKLKNCRNKLVEWQHTNHNNSARLIVEFNQKLEAEKQKGQVADKRLILNLEDDLQDAYEKDERYWKEKSRVEWLRWGDQNTKFFHAKFHARNR
ncbi:uncharacterized protein [Arachis hypogaea]|uniref:uncharacterized protein n=1 Tax=Arachis hypogaea TaxID=3818 RepID=UPI003B21D13D